MTLKQTNDQRVKDYSETATIQEATIFCAFAKTKDGKVRIFMSEVIDAKSTCAMLRKVADDMELNSLK